MPPVARLTASSSGCNTERGSVVVVRQVPVLRVLKRWERIKFYFLEIENVNKMWYTVFMGVKNYPHGLKSQRIVDCFLVAGH